MARVRGVAGSAELAKRAAGGIHLKLDDGQEATLCFAGLLKGGEEEEPLGIEIVWYTTKKGRRSEEYDPTKHDPSDASARFLWNVFVRDIDGEDVNEMKVWTQGPKVFKKWMTQKNKGRMGCWFVVERDGVEMDTEYTLAKQEKITKEELADIKQLDLHDLDKAAFSPEDDEDDDKPNKKNRRTAADEAPRTRSNQQTMPTEGNGAVSQEVATSLRQTIKDLPDSTTVFERFKTKFGISKLKDLPAEQQLAAEAWLDAVSQLGTPEPDPPKEADPFE